MTQTTAVPTASAAPAASAGRDDLVIKCANLSKTFRDFWLRNRVKAVEGVNLQVRRGQVFGLLGPNGSGKSTTIKMILGLLHPTAGRVAVFGKHPEDVKTKQQIGYLPEESYLYPFLNARETLEYYGRLFHLSRDQRRRRIAMLLEMVGLEQVARRPIGEYSKGMQRRIGLAQALINDPQLLILDEPTSGLDPIGTRQIKDLITELARRGKTILLCSHLLGDVEDVCDEVAIMFGGKVRTEGTVGELLLREGATLIQTPELEVEVIEAIEALLSKYGKHIEKVDQPRQKLEQLFLDIVHKAQAEGALTSGARSGGSIAGFLMDEEQRGAHLPEAVKPAKVIEQLVAAGKKQAETPPVQPPPQPAEASDKSAEPAAAPARPAASEQVIAQLTQQDKPRPAASSPAPDQPAAKPTPPADLSMINKLIVPGAAAAKATTPPPTPASPAPQPEAQAPPPEQVQPEATSAPEPPPPAPPEPQAASPDAPSETPSEAPPEAPKPPAEPKSDVPERPERQSDTGEKPDESFISALMNVEPYDPARHGQDGEKPDAAESGSDDETDDQKPNKPTQE